MESLDARCLLSGDVVIQWNQAVIAAIQADKLSIGPESRDLAIVQTAIYDAVDAIDHIASPFHVHAPTRGKTSPVAAAAAAGLVTASSLFPNDTALFQTAYQASLADVPSGPARTRGIALGTSVGEKTLISRANDGSNAVVNYTPGTAPGDWQPTPPKFAPAQTPQWGLVTPFALKSGSQFRPPPPPALDQRGLHGCLQRDQRLRTCEQHRPHARRDGGRQVLGRQSRHPWTSWLLERDSGKRGRISWQHVGPERAAVRPVECRGGRRRDRPL